MSWESSLATYTTNGRFRRSVVDTFKNRLEKYWSNHKLMLSSCCRTPQSLSFVGIKLKSVRLHPAGYSTGAAEPSGKDIDLGRSVCHRRINAMTDQSFRSAKLCRHCTKWTEPGQGLILKRHRRWVRRRTNTRSHFVRIMTDQAGTTWTICDCEQCHWCAPVAQWGVTVWAAITYNFRQVAVLGRLFGV